MSQDGKRYGGDKSDWHTAIFVFIAVTVVLSIAVSGLFEPVVSSLIIAGVFGAMVGWAAGILATPYQKDEKARLGGIAQVAAGVLTGYLAAKFDRMFEIYLGDSSAVETRAALMHVACFATMALVSLVLTYVTRSYDYEERSK